MRGANGLLGRAAIVRSEPLPRFELLARAQIEVGRPTRARGLSQQAKAGVLQLAICFARIATHAREDAVLPCGSAAARTWQHVIDAESIGRAFATAVLTREVIAQEQVPAREWRFVARYPVVAAQHDDFRNWDARRWRTHEIASRRLFEANPFRERVDSQRVRRDHARDIAHHHAKGAAHRRDMHGHPGPVQHECGTVHQLRADCILGLLHRKARRRNRARSLDSPSLAATPPAIVATADPRR